MPAWTYTASGGERYPVMRGELWQAGPHRLACGDLDWDALRLLERCDVIPDLVYTDPPWNAGNAASFRTKAGVPRKVDFRQLLTSMLDVVRLVRRYAFIEMGCEHTDLLARLIANSDGRILDCWPITYYRRNPCVLFCATWTGQPMPDLDLAGMDDSMTPYQALKAVRGPEPQVVFDPCLGRGLTARTADGLGMTCVGLELSPWRMSAALYALAKAGRDVACLGNLVLQDA